MPKTIEEYIRLGYDVRTAEYFAAGRKKLLSLTPNADFSLTLLYEGGERRRYDVLPLIKENTVFAPLSEPEIFYRAYLDAQNAIAWDIDPNVDSEVVWNNKIDLCPDSCYLDSVPLK